MTRRLSASSEDSNCIGYSCDAHRPQEYLKAIWSLEEEGKRVVRVKHLSKRLGLSMPSIVEMLKNLRGKNYIEYQQGEGVTLTPQGKRIAGRIMRNHRLMEVYMNNVLKIPVDERMVCGFSHHMTEEFSDFLCSSLGHPKKCSHGLNIPPCKQASKNRKT